MKDNSTPYGWQTTTANEKTNHIESHEAHGKTAKQFTPESEIKKSTVTDYQHYRDMAEIYNRSIPNIYTQQVMSVKHPCLL